MNCCEYLYGRGEIMTTVLGRITRVHINFPTKLIPRLFRGRADSDITPVSAAMKGLRASPPNTEQ